MKKITLLLVALFATAYTYADARLWLRYSAISPDGQKIAFAYKGDIFVVSSDGGRAVQLTTNPAFDSYPVWSPDGKKIAFSSDRMGGLDLFVVDSEGGIPTRLTTHQVAEKPIVFRDNNTILFSAMIQTSAESMQFPSGYEQVYSISINGGRPVMFSSLPLESISFAENGKYFLYNDKKGYEDPWRKHHTSSITRDIWKCELKGVAGESEEVKNSQITKVADFKGEDRNPVLTQDGKSFYYLSEQDGSFNIYKKEIALEAKPVQITSYKDNPVRFLTMSQEGVLCFGYDGEIYTMEEGKEATKINVEIVADKIDKDIVRRVARSGASDMAVSKDGKQIAFIYHGDVYVTSPEYTTTKQITNTAEQERNIDFAPDGRTLIYSSERGGLWQIYASKIVNKEEKLFQYSTEIEEERVTNSNVASFEPSFSPDGKEIAFLENRTAIKVINLKSKKVRTVMDGKYQYSYADGDQWYQWSPDGKWILSDCIFDGGWNNKDVALIDASGNGLMHNLTQSGYNDSGAKWVLGGKAMIWRSDRAGYRSHGSWGAEEDIYIMFFDLEAYEKFRMNKEDLAILADAQKGKDKKEKDEKKEVEREKKVKKSKDKLELDIENAEFRVMRLTGNSSFLGDAVLNKEGTKLYYMAAFEDDMDLWVHDLKTNSTSILMKGIGYGSMKLSADGSSVYVLGGRGMSKVSLASGKPSPIGFDLIFDHKPYGERNYIFEHTWQQVQDKFYDPNIHGIDWSGYRETYKKFLPHITNGYDFAEMLSEMLGELNGSHTGSRYRPWVNVLGTATLGLFYDQEYKGDGLKIKEIVKRSPLDLVKNEVKPGWIITKIDGNKILAGQDYYPLFEGKIGKKVRLTIAKPSGKEVDVVVKAISYGAQNGLLYQRWVDRNKEMVDKLSGGRLGYVHIEGMDSRSFRKLYSEALGKNRDKDALIVDTRHNGGGWLHDDVVTFLSGKKYQEFAPRGQYIGSDPFNKWLKPSCMLVCEDNYSNAHGTPWVYKHLGIGKLVGAPVPGTMTAVWWEYQIDGSTIIGIPQVGCRDLEGNYLENQELEPDVLIYNSLVDVMNGRDTQLQGAVKTLQAR